MSNLITTYEQTVAGYLEKNLDRTRVRLWADAFASNERTRMACQLFFGLQGVDYGAQGIFHPDRGQVVRSKTLRFEIQALIHTLDNHQAALELIEFAIELLDSYRPYEEIGAIVPRRYGSPRRNNNDGSWTYSGEVAAEIWSNATALTLIEESSTYTPQIISVGLLNMQAGAARQLDREWS